MSRSEWTSRVFVYVLDQSLQVFMPELHSHYTPFSFQPTIPFHCFSFFLFSAYLVLIAMCSNLSTYIDALRLADINVVGCEERYRDAKVACGKKLQELEDSQKALELLRSLANARPRELSDAEVSQARDLVAYERRCWFDTNAARYDCLRQLEIANGGLERKIDQLTQALAARNLHETLFGDGASLRWDLYDEQWGQAGGRQRERVEMEQRERVEREQREKQEWQAKERREHERLRDAEKRAKNAKASHERLDIDRRAAANASSEALDDLTEIVQHSVARGHSPMTAKRISAAVLRCIAAEKAVSKAESLRCASSQELREALSEESRLQEQVLESMCEMLAEFKNVVYDEPRRERDWERWVAKEEERREGLAKMHQERADRLAKEDKERYVRFAREQTRVEKLTVEWKRQTKVAEELRKAKSAEKLRQAKLVEEQRQAKLAEERQQRERLAKEVLRQRQAKCTTTKTTAERIAAWKAEVDAAFSDYATMQTFPAPPVIMGPKPSFPVSADYGGPLRSCDSVIREAFQMGDKRSLKLERLRWHPDRFSCCPEQHREAFKKMAQKIFVVIDDMYQKAG